MSYPLMARIARLNVDVHSHPQEGGQLSSVRSNRNWPSLFPRIKIKHQCTANYGCS